jgi:large subunit ribosomal protein L18
MHTRNQQLKKRQIRIRSELAGTSKRPRLTVKRSNQRLSAQLVDDSLAKTINTFVAEGKNQEAAKKLGQQVAGWAKEHRISQMVFDRSGYLYHGSVAALAQAVRDGGIKI